ncbi:MAG: PPC domain-containing protein [Anaerolineae bacterium]|nr:PPC domain-containing protein [Anaerolineae bacterium]
MRSSRWLIMLMMALISVGAVWAQEATPETTAAGNNLVYSVAAQGSITNEAFSQSWTLQTASADRLSIRVERLDGNLIPGVVILDAANAEISTSYGADRTGAVAEIGEYTLPAGGTYTVVVSRDDGEAGVTTGSYSIFVTPLATALENPNNSVVLGEVTTDAPVVGEITGTRWYHRYTYNATSADQIRVTARRTGGTLFPLLEVLDANGISLTTGYSDYSSGNDNARIDRFSLPTAGTYTIVVSRDGGFNNDTVGTYELNVEILGFGADNPALQTPVGAAAYDTDLTGELGAVWYQDWTLAAAAGDTITVTVERLSGNVQLVVTLLGGSGQTLISGYADRSSAKATVDRYQLTGPGSYTVRVSRVNDQDGWTTGGYTLRVRVDGAGAETIAAQAPVGTAAVDNEPRTGEITNGSWSQIWTIEGQQGTVLDFVAQRTSGTLIPRIDIRDANGQILRSGYAEASQDVAKIEGFALPGTGTFQIVVVRDGDQNGYTSGGYSLTVTPTG